MNTQVKGQGEKSQKTNWQESLTLVNNLLLPSQEAVIVLRNNPSFDTLVSGIALSFAFKKIGRKVHIISPTPLNLETIASQTKGKVNLNEIPGLDQVLPFLPQKQLRIVMDYSTGTFSKAEMKKSSEGLLINLSPEQGEQPIEPLNVAIQVLDSKPDIAFLLEVENLFHLGDFYNKNQSFFKNTSIVNIDYHSNNALFGKANLIDTKASSLSEMIALMVYDLRLALDEEIAKILYQGIKFKTDGFSANFFTANMLEATSICLRYQQRMPTPQQGM